MNKLPDTPLALEPGNPDDSADAQNAGDAALPPGLESRRDQMFPKLEPAEIERLRRFDQASLRRGGRRRGGGSAGAYMAGRA